MTDIIGLLELPVQIPAAGEAAGDPFLTIFGSFLQAVINADTKDAWKAIHPATIKPQTEPCPVTVVKTHDPDEADFRSNYLPALFVYRGTVGKRQRISQDLQIVPSTINVLWVPPRAPQKELATRQPFKHAIESAIDNALDGGRHRAWIVPGDLDPKAADYGSNFYVHAKLFEEAVINSSKNHLLKLQNFDSDRTAGTDDFDCFLIEIEIRECKRRTPEGYDLLAHAEHGIFINEPKLLFNNVNFPASPYIRAVSFDTVPTTGGIDVLEIHGQSFSDECSVTIGGVLATGFQFINDTLITCLPPAHAAGAVDVVVTDELGRTSGTTGAGLLTYV